MKKQVVIRRKYTLREKCNILLNYIQKYKLQQTGGRSLIMLDSLLKESFFGNTEESPDIANFFTLYSKLPSISTDATEKLARP